MKIETGAEQAFFSTLRIQAEASERSMSGTGFVFRLHHEGKHADVVVTNKHVVKDAQKVTLHFVRGNGETPPLPLFGQSVSVTINGPSTECWTGHPDDGIDVAVCPLEPIVADLRASGQPPYVRIIGSELIPTEEQWDDLNAVEDVLFVGYPNGLYDVHNHTPIARRGVTATPPQLDYCGRPQFLVDASVFPGSSGSPVMICNDGLHVERGGVVSVKSRLHLLGIIAAVHVRRDMSPIVPTEMDAGWAAQNSHPLNLGIVFKAKTILETVAAGMRAPAAENLESGAESSAT